MNQYLKCAVIFILCLSLILAIIFAIKIFPVGNSQKLPNNLIRSYNIAYEERFLKQHNLTIPYAVFFKTDDHELMYIAARHEADPASSTHRMITKAFENFSPDMVLVEGFDAESFTNSKNLKKIKESYLPNLKCGEPLYAVYLAATKNISVTSPEPQYKTIVKQLNNVYTAQDIAFYYFARQIPQYFRENRNLTEKELPKLFKPFMSSIIGNQQYSYEEYQAWLQKKLGDKAGFQTLINPESTAPIENGQYLQRLSSNLRAIRDEYIVKMILQKMAKYKRVLIIFGASHYPMQKEALEKAFGVPAYYFRSADEMKKIIR